MESLDNWTTACRCHKRSSSKSHPKRTASLESPLALTEGNVVLFAPFDGHLPEFDLLEPIPCVPQVVFGKQAFEQAEGACTADATTEIIPRLRVFQCLGKAVQDGPLVDIELVR